MNAQGDAQTGLVLTRNEIWLLLHALYAQFVGGDRSSVARLRAEAQRYIDTNGRHGELASEWLKVVTSS